MNRTGQQSCLMRLPMLRGIERDCFEAVASWREWRVHFCTVASQSRWAILITCRMGGDSLPLDGWPVLVSERAGFPCDPDTVVQSETKYAAVPQPLSLPSDKRTPVCDRRGQGGFDEYIRHNWIAAEG